MPLRGDRLRAAREQKGLSQRALSLKCGLAFNMLYRYENGQTDPSINTIEKIARELDVSLDYLVGFSSTPRGQLTESTLTPEERNLLVSFREGGWKNVIQLGAERLAK